MIVYQFFDFKLKWISLKSLFFLLAFSPKISICQQPALEFKKIGESYGLSNSTIECIFQDSRGFIWVGTRDGLNRFDGSRMVVFKPDTKAAESLTDGYITCLYEDSHQQIWVGTSNGLNRFNPQKNKFTQFKNKPADTKTLSHNYITSITSDKNGFLWIGTAGGGVNRYNPSLNNFQRYTTETAGNLASNFINCIYKDANQNFWVGSENGIQQLNPETGYFKNLENFERLGVAAISPVAVVTIKEDKTGNLLLGTSNQGLLVYNRQLGSMKHYMHIDANPFSLATNLVRSICVDKNGSIWTGTINGGLNLFDPVAEKFYSYQNQPDDPTSLSQRTVSALLEDNQGNLWVGTHRGGVNLLIQNNEKFRHYRQLSNQNSLSYNDVRGFCEDKSGNIWIGTDGGGLNLFERKTGRFTHFKHQLNDAKSLSSNEVLSIAEDSDGMIWVGTWGGGLCLYNATEKKFERYQRQKEKSTSLSSDYIQKIFEDSKKNIWIATYFGGLNLFDKNKKTFTRVVRSKSGKTQLSGNNVISICEDAAGNIWIGTDDAGLNKLNIATGEFEHYFTNNEKKPDLRVLFADSKGNLWVGQKGLYQYSRSANNFFLFTNAGGLDAEFIKGITEDEKGNLWVSTSNGITRLHPETKTARKYNIADGLQGLEFEANAYLKTKDGAMLFGGLNGFNLFYPEDIVPNNYIPPVFVTSFMIDNKKVDAGAKDGILAEDISFAKTISLSHLQSTFSFEFAALNYTASDNNQFQYKLENWDAGWVNAGSERKASYINVSPGTYTFTVKASNNDDVWNENGYSIKVVIKPPFWQTWWFRALIAAIVISGVYYFYKTRKKIELQKLEEEKKEEIHQMRLQFFTNISHEFRTPLSLIAGPVEKLLNENPSEKNKHTYQVIQRNANRLLQLINELMDFRKAESGVLKLQVMPGSLPVFLEEIAEEFSEVAAQKSIQFRIVNQLTGSEIWFDRQVAEKIIINLLGNSFKYTPGNGTITLEVIDTLASRKPLFENELAIPGNYTAHKMIYFCVTDNGIGVSKESITHLFERYYRVSDMHLGSGIGLAFVKHLTQLHKGVIHVYSERNKGTEIIIGIPCSREDYSEDEKWLTKNESASSLESLKTFVEETKQENKPAVHTDTMPAKKNYSILVTDDNDELRNFLKDALESQFSVLEAADGKAAFEMTLETYPDIIISDIMMPVMNGNEFCKQIKSNQETAHIPFIMLTAKSGIESQIEGTSLGADYYFSKPVSIELLSLTLRNIIAQKNKLREKYQRDYNADVKELVNNAKEKEFIEELIKTIEDNLQEPEMDIEFLCKKMGMSRTKLYNKIKNITGQAISDFVRTVRLRKAAQLLAQKDCSITEAMYSVGIQTQSYFTRVFKNEFGKTPTQFLNDLESK